MRRLAVVGVLVAGLVAAACGGKDEPLGPTATLPSATTTTDPYAVPEVIDEAYVNRVLTGLDQIVGDAVRLVASTKSIPEEAMDRFRAVYASDDFLELKVRLLQEDLNGDLEGFAETPGNQISAVTQLLSVSSRCVFAAIDRDYGQVSASPTGTINHQWVALQREDGLAPSLNPTGWALIYDGFEPGRQQPRDPCAES